MAQQRLPVALVEIFENGQGLEQLGPAVDHAAARRLISAASKV
jgi:hypothetical protein